MTIKPYLNEKFPNLQLIPSLYEQWDIGIHFFLGKNIHQFKHNGQLNDKMFATVYEQVQDIFNDLFDQEDELLLVTNIYRYKKQRQVYRIKVYQPNIKDKSILKQLQMKTYPYPFETDENEIYEMQQFFLCCKVKDVRIDHLLKGTIHEDFPLKPRFTTDHLHYPDVFFINRSKDIIFFIYDDRGCEVIAKTPEKLRVLYKKYTNWIDPINRQQIENRLGL